MLEIKRIVSCGSLVVFMTYSTLVAKSHTHTHTHTTHTHTHTHTHTLINVCIYIYIYGEMVDFGESKKMI